jgi:hypothetical protein
MIGDDDTSFLGQLLQMAHSGFMATSWVFTALTLAVVGHCLYRLIPKRPTHRIIRHESHERDGRR